MFTVAALLAILIGNVLLEARYVEESEEVETAPSLSPCEHESEAIIFKPRSGDGCEECVKNNYKWVHLRLCLSCGHVGCCDSSKYTHATKHFHSEGHPVMASLEEKENWAWCYVDERYVPLEEQVGTMSGER
jgi:monovalent cation/hydrogen antiporter